MRNFRAIKEAVFKPKEEGITGIFGPNGAGKTSFLAATLFALYGVKPPGANQNSLRRIGSTGESSVSVVFEHLAQQVEIIREIKTPNNRVVVNIYVDGVPQTVTSVTAADQWMKNRLGIDSSGFMTAFVVRQKELDQLVQAKPAERKQIIEKLAGVDAINTALKAAREDENNVKKSLNHIPGSEEEAERAGEIVEAAASRVQNLKTEIRELQNEMKPLEGKVSNIKADVEKISESSNRIAALTAKQETLASEMQYYEDELSKLPELYEDELSIEKLREMYGEEKQKLSESKDKLAGLKFDLARKEETFNSFTVSKKTIEEEISVIENSFKTDFNYEEEIEKLNKETQSMENQIFNLGQKIEESEESIKTLNHSQTCPTCLQDLTNPEKIIENLQDVIQKFSEEKIGLETRLEETTTLYNKTVVEYSFQQKSETLKAKLEELTKTQPEYDMEETRKVYQKLETETAELEKTVETLETRGVKLKEAQNVETQRQTLTVKKTQTLTSITKIEEELNSLTQNIGGVAKLKEIETLNKIEQELNQHKITLSEKKTQLAVAEQKHSTEKTNYKTVKQNWEKKKKLIQNHSSLALTSDFINKFRLNTIASLAPELSETATGLISEMTNGDFTEIRLDEEFNTYLTDSSGIERPSSWLSGGEESAVALALRISIAFLITGGNPALLWLDEVLTAQDADRRNTMLTMIRQLPIQQIIMINHTHEAADIVDKTVEIIPNIAEGSIIKESELNYADREEE